MGTLALYVCVFFPYIYIYKSIFYWGVWVISDLPLDTPLLSTHLRTWFKGADTHSVARWVEHKFSGHADEYLQSIHQTAQHGNEFMRKLYHCGLWMEPSNASLAIRSGMKFLKEYRVCAQFAFEAKKCRFKIPPKYHAFVHIDHAMINDLGKISPKTLEANTPSILNPLCYSCQLDEDFVGQVSALSRTGNISTAHDRVMNLYLLNLAKYW